MSVEEYLILVLVVLLLVVVLTVKIMITNERLRYENHILRFVAAAQQAELEKLKGTNESIPTENVEHTEPMSEIS